MRLDHITPKCFGLYATCNATLVSTKSQIVRNFQIAKGKTSFPGGNSEWEPPDPFSNSEVKTLSADGSVGSPHVRVGHRQDLYLKKAAPGFRVRLFFCAAGAGGKDWVGLLSRRGAM